MEFGIFNLMGSRDPTKPTAEVFAEVAEQTRLADELGYAIAWFAEHHFSNYCLCASPLMLVARPPSFAESVRFVFSPRPALSMYGATLPTGWTSAPTTGKRRKRSLHSRDTVKLAESGQCQVDGASGTAVSQP